MKISGPATDVWVNALGRIDKQLFWKLNPEMAAHGADSPGPVDYDGAMSVAEMISEWCYQTESSILRPMLHEIAKFWGRLHDHKVCGINQDALIRDSIASIITLLKLAEPVERRKESLRHLNRKGKHKASPTEIRKYMRQLREGHPEKKYSERTSLTANHFGISESLVRHTKTQ